MITIATHLQKDRRSLLRVSRVPETLLELKWEHSKTVEDPGRACYNRLKEYEHSLRRKKFLPGHVPTVRVRSTKKADAYTNRLGPKRVAIEIR